jgi:hypothetical protein
MHLFLMICFIVDILILIVSKNIKALNLLFNNQNVNRKYVDQVIHLISSHSASFNANDSFDKHLIVTK